jgi:mono/diheme cytochrome c family protein
MAAATLLGCGGSSQEEGAGTAQESSPPAQTGAAGEAPGDKGVGPIDHFDVATLDMTRASEGEEIFTVKCTACHKIEERYIGPALSGITKRRTPEWILNMILNPDVMVKENEAAKALLVEYLAPMTNQNLTEEEARLVLTYFLDADEKLVE